ncbi:MAG: hypothetical protein H6718_21195 [Polyangiaceae bacterium]|nr:hypothetical protein [Polyangiaceae bacterium]
MSDEQPPPEKATQGTELQGQVVKPPYPTDDGHVVVEILAEDGAHVRGLFKDSGYDADVGREGTLAHRQLAMRLLDELDAQSPLTPLLQEAHRMRRAAWKHNTSYDLSRRGQLLGPPEPGVVTQPGRNTGKKLVVLQVESLGVQYEVALFEDGFVVEWVDDWDLTTEQGRHDACATGVNWVLEHPEEAAALGLQVDLFRLFYE